MDYGTITNYFDYLAGNQSEEAAELARTAESRTWRERAEQEGREQKAAQEAAEKARRADQLDQALRMKSALRDSLDMGAPAPYLAMQSLVCIGQLTGDDEYSDHAAEVMRATYPDIEQTSMYCLEAMEAEHNLDQLVQEFCNIKAAKMTTIEQKAETIMQKARECNSMVESLRAFLTNEPERPN